VSAKYVIRYDSDAVSAAFQLPDGGKRENLRRLAMETMRSHIAARYTSMRSVDGMALLGFAYLDPALFEIFVRLGFAGFAQSDVVVTLPAWFTGGAAQRVRLQNALKQVLITLYNVENRFLNRLLQLDAAVDALRDGLDAVSVDDLNELVREFVEMSDDLGDFRENAFFAVFDRLVHEGSGGKALRNSSLVLAITPPGGKTVTKVLTAARPVAGVSETPANAGPAFETAARSFFVTAAGRTPASAGFSRGRETAGHTLAGPTRRKRPPEPAGGRPLRR